MVKRYSTHSQRNFLLVLGIIFILITAYLIKDIFILIVLSFILAYFLFPIFKYFNKKIDNSRLSSLLTLFVSTLFLFIPLALLSYFLILNLIKLVVDYRVYIENPILLNEKISFFIENFTNSTALSTINYSDYFTNAVVYVLEFSKSFFTSIPVFLLNFLIILFITYYVLMYNRKMFRTLNEYIPLNLRRQDEILNSLQKNLKVLFKGYFITGIIQTMIAVFGYIVFGAPNILIITIITLFTSLIPYLGTPLVWVPVSIYMIITGNEFGGVGLLIFGTLVISMVDNFLRPILMSHKDTISPPLVFVGFVGGMLAFGIIGIILGPIIISTTSILLRYLRENYELKE